MNTAATQPSTFELLLIVELGAFRNVAEYDQAMRVMNMYIMNNPSEYPPMQFVGDTGTKLDLVVCKKDDLDPDAPFASRIDFEKATQTTGLKFCPVEAAFALRLQYLDQPIKETLWMVIPSTQNPGTYDYFSIASSVGGKPPKLWFTYHNLDGGQTPQRWHDDTKFVFVRPRNAA